MARHIFRAMLIVCSLVVGQATASPVSVPPALEGWRGWALDGQEFRRCPLLSSADASDASSFKCVWPERLALTLDSRGGRFAQRWQLFAEGWVRLPGNVEHWPLSVRVNGNAGAVVLREGFPALRLPAGSHAVTGEFGWSTRPESIDIDPRTALVDLTLDGRNVAQPERPAGAVWLGKRRSAEQPERMEVQVYRLLRDETPAWLVTRIRLQVAGEAREELLGPVLPEGFLPVSLASALPARLEQEGKLRVQVRPGSWEITLGARAAGVAAELKRPAVQGAWAREEIWSFESNDRLRIAAVEGAEGVDPAQANVPVEWRRDPAFRMAADSRLTVVERTRGLQNVDDNRLSLSRSLWLDFDHGGLTGVDRIRGRMLRDWRLETVAPFAVQSASMGAESLLVTRNPRGEGVGLEVRAPNLALQATTRSSRSGGSLPASGWSTRFDSVSGELILPPGHRLLAVVGADQAPTSWLERWGLWGVFGVLVVAVFAGWLAGVPVGAIAFLALLLTYQEGPEYIWLWSNLLAAMALARAAPEGRLQRFARGYRLASFVVLGIALLPMLWGQVRLALYPQLEAGGVAIPAPIQTALPEEAPRMANAADSAAPAAKPEEIMVTAQRRQAEAEASYSKSAVGTSGRAAGGLNYQQVVQRYAPGTLLQTGPGIPHWRYQAHPYSWSGPVEPAQTVRFIYAGPFALGTWRIAGVILLAALFAALASAAGLVDRRGPPPAWLSRWRAAGPLRWRGGTAAAACVLAFFISASPPARAESTPETRLLQELKERLTRAPECMPSCAEITSVRAEVSPGTLDMTLEVSALATMAVAIPGAADRWQLESVTVDGRASLAVAREQDDSLWVPLSAGAHTVRLTGRLASAESVQIAFPMPPRHVTIRSDGWEVAGVSEGRLLSGSIELTRRRSVAEHASPLDAGTEFPAFVRVTRNIDLGLDWSVTTVVERVAPEKAAMSVEVPLIAGESVLSDGVEVRDAREGGRAVLIGLERGQQSARWGSGLPRSEQLQLQVPANTSRAEVWRISVSPQWNVEFAGLPAVLPADEGSAAWVYEFHPRPGEKLQLHLRRPQRAEGATLAIDSARQGIQVGKRSATSTLDIEYRSTQGGRHSIGLPKGARVTSVSLDGAPAQVRPVDDELPIELRPGAHALRVEWSMPQGVATKTRPAPVDLRSPASNLYTVIDLPSDRWPLLAFGGGVGPVVLYWGELVIFIATAWLLGRWRHSPLRTHEWLLLGFGLSTRSWGVLVLVALWLFALRWREGWSGTGPRWRFNLVQALLAALSVIAVGSLVFSGIRGSLLASPDMGVAGPGSFGNHFEWFHDRTVALLSQPTVISAPMWLYRVLMFAWALWLVFALLRWLRWAWRAWKTNGIWRGPARPAPSAS